MEKEEKQENEKKRSKEIEGMVQALRRESILFFPFVHGIFVHGIASFLRECNGWSSVTCRRKPTNMPS